MAHTGKFYPKNPKKYAGDSNNIWYRSSWELKFMQWVDMSENVIYWASEELVIKYFNPVDNKIHRYFPDFVVKIKKKDGLVMTYVIEIKPEYQTKQPVSGNKKTKRFIKESIDYVVNQSKWKAATEFCKDHGWEFKVLTEKDLFE
jgi:hypothetical protein